MRACIISLGSKSSKWTAASMKRYFSSVDEIDMREIEVILGKKEMQILYHGEPLKEYDCLYVKGSFRYAQLSNAITSSLWQKTYMPIKADAFTTGHNKFLTHIKLQEEGIPMPLTYLSATIKSAKKLLANISYPIIMKFPEGTQGKGVMVAESYAGASSMLDALSSLKQPFIIQEFIETGGKDIRAFVIGDHVAAAMERKAVEGEKRANIHAGGIGKQIELDIPTQKLAVRTAKALGCEICGVDLLMGAKGPVVVEINLSPGLQGITKATKIDLADKIASHLHANTGEFVKSREVKTGDVLTEIGVDSAEKAPAKEQEIITALSIKGNRLVLPEVVTNITDFDEKHEVVIRAKKGRVNIEKF